MSDPVIALEGLSKVFAARRGRGFGQPSAEVRAVDEVSFAVGRKETLALVGESGCGKSTTGRLILRLIAYLQAGWEPQVATFADGLCRWDCEWYVILAKSGYDTFPTATGIDAGNWAFFPLYPIIVGALHAASGAPVMVLATGASIIFSAIAALVAWPLLNRDIRAPRPMQVDAARAARLIRRGLDRRRPVIAFPRTLYWGLRLLAFLPAALGDRILDRPGIAVPQTAERAGEGR